MNENTSIGRQLGVLHYPLRIYNDDNELIYYEDLFEFVYYFRDENNSMDIICGMVKY